MKMNDILQTIVACKRREVADWKKTADFETALTRVGEGFSRPTHSMRASLAASGSGIIAEFKRKSPSKGWLYPDADAAEVVPDYKRSGAGACSILTDGPFFGGSLEDLRRARERVKNLPLLRKDFIVDASQLHQARAAGADAVLLIASVLTPDECAALAETAHGLDLEVLLEVHAEDELGHLNRDIDMLGVNNRHLGTFHTDVENSFRLADRMREAAEAQGFSPLLVSESGLAGMDTVRRLRAVGFRGFLIGETFMKTGHPGRALSEFLNG